MPATHFLTGFGLEDYTPQPINNAFRIYDPISFRALILQDSDTNVTLLCGDCFSIETDVLQRVKAQLRDIPWLTLDHILPCASHIGTAPILFQSYVNQPCDALKFFGREDEFATHMATAVRKAAQAMRPSCIGLGHHSAPGIVYNRRSYDKNDGHLVMSNFMLPYPRPELRYGPVDDNVYVIRIDDLEGHPQHCACSFGCHALCSTDKYGNISADYPGVMRSVIECAGINALFFPGSIGNVVPISRGGRTAQRVGNSVGGAAILALEQIETVEAPHLTVSRKVMSLGSFKHPDKSESEAVLVATPEESDGRERFQAYGSRRLSNGGSTTQDYPITRIQIGEAQLIYLPGEIFVETAQAIKRAAGDHLTVVLSGPTADIGYLSPPSAHHEGGMEPQFAGLDIHAETTIRNAACEMAQAPFAAHP